VGQAASLSYRSTLPSDPIRYGYRTFENCYKGVDEDRDERATAGRPYRTQARLRYLLSIFTAPFSKDFL